MASPSTVITLGYGSFGSVNLVPTLGYGIGVAVESTGRLEFTFPRSLLDYTFPLTPDITLDGNPGETMEQP